MTNNHPKGMLDQSVAKHRSASMISTIKSLSRLIILLALGQCAICYAQTDAGEDQAEQSPGRYLLDLSYSTTDSIDGNIDVFSPGFTWLVRPYLRVGASTTFLYFSPSDDIEMKIEGIGSHRGLGDSVFYLQYDWQDRLTASPWVPDNAGTVVSVQVPTGKAEDFLGGDTWAAGLSTSWPILIEKSWLLNPAIAYMFSNGMGIGLDYGRTKRHSITLA